MEEMVGLCRDELEHNRCAQLAEPQWADWEPSVSVATLFAAPGAGKASGGLCRRGESGAEELPRSRFPVAPTSWSTSWPEGPKTTRVGTLWMPWRPAVAGSCSTSMRPKLKRPACSSPLQGS